MEIPSVSGFSLREAAVAYARAGLYVGPINMKGVKNPGYLLGKGWPEKTSNDPDVVDGWFDGVGKESWHRSDVEIDGIFLHVGRSGLVVLDVDDADTLPAWMAELFRKSKPAKQYTNDSKKKFHAVFDTKGERYGNGRGQLEEGWGEVRGANGVILLEPSPHPKVEQGGRYKWSSRDIPGLPQVLADKLKAAREPDPFDSVETGLGYGSPVPHGARDETMFRFAAALRARNLDRESALILMRERAKDFDNSDGKVHDAFLLDKLEKAWSYQPGTTAEQEQAGLAPEDEEMFWKARPELTHIRDFARAQRAAPWAVLGITLARILMAVPPQFVIPATIGAETSLNFYVALCGRSGAGKSGTHRVSRSAIPIDGDRVPRGIGSGEGVAASYVEYVPKKGTGANMEPAHHRQYETKEFLYADEVSKLGSLASRGGSTLLDVLRSAWGGEALGQANRAADTKLLVDEASYRLCFWVGVQPDAADVLLAGEGVGTPQRFVWLSVVDKNRPKPPPPRPEPMPWSLPSFPRQPEGDDDWLDTSGWTAPIELCDTAVRDITEAADAALEDREGMDGHLLLCQVKVAAALGLLSGHWDVSEEDWALAGQVMSHSNGVRAALVATQRAKAAKAVESQGKARAVQEVMVKEAIENRDVARVEGKILRALSKSREGLTRTELNRKLSSPDKPWVDDALTRLGDRIKETTDVVDTRHPVTRYVLHE